MKMFLVKKTKSGEDSTNDKELFCNDHNLEVVLYYVPQGIVHMDSMTNDDCYQLTTIVTINQLPINNNN